MNSPSDIRTLGFAEGGWGKREEEEKRLRVQRGKKSLLNGLALTVTPRDY